MFHCKRVLPEARGFQQMLRIFINIVCHCPPRWVSVQPGCLLKLLFALEGSEVKTHFSKRQVFGSTVFSSLTLNASSCSDKKASFCRIQIILNRWWFIKCRYTLSGLRPSNESSLATVQMSLMETLDKYQHFLGSSQRHGTKKKSQVYEVALQVHDEKKKTKGPQARIDGDKITGTFQLPKAGVEPWSPARQAAVQSNGLLWLLQRKGVCRFTAPIRNRAGLRIGLNHLYRHQANQVVQ